MNRLKPMGEVPAGLPDGVAAYLGVMQENMEILMGMIGDKKERPIKFGDVQAADADPQQSAYSVAGPTKAEFDVAVDDITNLRARFNYLVALLRGEDVGA